MGRPKLPEGEKMIQKVVLLTPEQLDRIEKWSIENKSSVSEIIRSSIDKYFNLEKRWKHRKWEPKS